MGSRVSPGVVGECHGSQEVGVGGGPWFPQEVMGVVAGLTWG